MQGSGGTEHRSDTQGCASLLLLPQHLHVNSVDDLVGDAVT